MADHRFNQQNTESLIAELHGSKDEALRQAIVERFTPLVRSIAKKFVRPGVDVEDLVQTAWLALLRALDRFDPGRGTKFITYAMHCMVGEIKRYFRDRTWSMKVPRLLQEIALSLQRRQDKLAERLGRKPTMGELAAAFGVSEETLAEAIELYQNYQPTSLEDRMEGEEGAGRGTVADTIGAEDPGLRAVVENAPLHAALRELKPRDQLILRRRFYEGQSQHEVARGLGVSQMHISRLERAALRSLRVALRPADITGETPQAVSSCRTSPGAR
jgi:RNA polymerase sigma-70 factor (sigma-B/F/G subfamily)